MFMMPSRQLRSVVLWHQNPANWLCVTGVGVGRPMPAFGFWAPVFQKSAVLVPCGTGQMRIQSVARPMLSCAPLGEPLSKSPFFTKLPGQKPHKGNVKQYCCEWVQQFNKLPFGPVSCTVSEKHICWPGVQPKTWAVSMPDVWPGGNAAIGNRLGFKNPHPEAQFKTT